MDYPMPGHAWWVIGESVRGASHIRADLPNQDALAWLPASGEGCPLVVAVADGHGSAKSFRSDRGARFAVAVALAVMAEFLDGQGDEASLSAVKRLAEDKAPQEMARRWRELVEADLAAEPFTDEEWARLEARDGARGRRKVEATPVLAYGATLLTALATDAYFLYLQLGDGDILTVSAEGEVSRPLPRDERLFANETTSLSGKDAWRDFRVGFQALSGPPPALVLLATDGYANSFVNDTAFQQVGIDLLAMLREDGVDAVRAGLPTWLEEASAAGSGDDITVALIWTEDSPPTTDP